MKKHMAKSTITSQETNLKLNIFQNTESGTGQQSIYLHLTFGFNMATAKTTANTSNDSTEAHMLKKKMSLLNKSSVKHLTYSSITTYWLSLNCQFYDNV